MGARFQQEKLMTLKKEDDEMVRILDWNVCSMNGAENKIDYLKRNLDEGSFIAILQ